MSCLIIKQTDSDNLKKGQIVNWPQKCNHNFLPGHYPLILHTFILTLKHNEVQNLIKHLYGKYYINTNIFPHIYMHIVPYFFILFLF